MSATEPFRSRWKRRVRTIPLMLAVTAAGVLASPILLLGGVAFDLAQRRYRLPTARMTLFLLQYAINDSVEIALAPVLWVRAGFGLRLHQPASMQRHQRLQQWSLEVLARRAQHLLGVQLEIDPESAGALTPGPVIVLCRHVSVLDASLPSLLYQRRGYRTRGVIMAELLADPGFDLIYARTGSVFITRDHGPDALARLRDLAVGVDSVTAMVIFPEGRLFRPEVLTRAMGRLRDTNPERAERLAALSTVLPPRPGGVLALLDALPQTDVVIMAHAGLDRFGSFRELARAVPLRDPLPIGAWRVAAADIPAADQDRIAWLDHQWIGMQHWVTQHTGPKAPPR